MRIIRVIASVATLGACGGSDGGGSTANACEDPLRGPTMARFADVTSTSGIDFQYYSADFKAGGLAVADLDGDGLRDVLASRRGGGLAMFRNLGSLRFEATETGIDPTLAVRAIAAADLDNDGDVDLVLAGSDVAYVMANRGDGTFDEVRRVDGSGSTEQVLPVDIDGDGRLDLYFSNYDVLSRARSQDWLYLNRDGFELTAVAAGSGNTWTTTAFDADDDGDQDLYVANDTLLADFGRPVTTEPATSTLLPDQFLRNDGSAQLTDIAAAMGLTTPRSSMGGLLGDFDEDGRLDLYVPNLGAKKLFIREAAGGYVERAAAFGVGGIARVSDACPLGNDDPDCLLLSWSAALSDFDLDGYDELLVVNGVSFSGQRPPPVLMFARGPTLPYHEVAPNIGCLDARGLVVTDLDGDGDQDLVITQNNGPLVVYETRGRPDPDAWLLVQLQGQSSNRDGVGAIVRARLASGRQLIRAVASGGVINSASPAETFFGIGNDVVDELVVQWPSGRRSDVTRPGSGPIQVVEPI